MYQPTGRRKNNVIPGRGNDAGKVDDPYESSRHVTVGDETLARVTRVAVRMLDDVIDLTPWPLPQQAAEARRTRRIGLGITGLADALILLGLRYSRAGGRQAAAAALNISSPTDAQVQTYANGQYQTFTQTIQNYGNTQAYGTVKDLKVSVSGNANRVAGAYADTITVTIAAN